LSPDELWAEKGDIISKLQLCEATFAKYFSCF